MNLINIREAAKMLNVPISFLYARTRTNQVPHLKLGKYCRFDPEQLKQWVDRQKRGPEDGDDRL